MEPGHYYDGTSRMAGRAEAEGEAEGSMDEKLDALMQMLARGFDVPPAAQPGWPPAEGGEGFGVIKGGFGVLSFVLHLAAGTL